ncbi:mitochondrial 54S ribosomal protein mL58 [Magnusiomyces paraingens]|uniref:54S ribosomal protein L20, mitochondrial n=1 Tax=Magnusiomyces paraingens TaxID=2606893 RepID=A0A5E8C4U2_9ASCO|nr:uncharacterized protein SAPINGB_P005468 [Saprochaete ingens]VVT56981.1 unnamed protein product [Saprochaete ingens]
MKNLRLAGQIRNASSFAKKSDVATPFPTKFHPTRSANTTKINLPAGVVHNPPASAPSPHQTPSAFLPADDARRHAVWNTKQEHQIENMPPLTEPTTKKYHLTEADISEIQRLRLEDPEKWTRKALAEKFKCSPFFVSIVSKPNEERQQKMDQHLDTIKSNWTEHRTNARRDRQRRRELWLRDV